MQPSVKHGKGWPIMQTDIREGLARELFEDAMCEHQTFGVETRKKVWEKECDDFRARADNLITYLRSEGLVRKVEGELPDKGEWWAKIVHLDESKTTIFVSVYWNAQQDMLQAGYTLIEEI